MKSNKFEIARVRLEAVRYYVMIGCALSGEWSSYWDGFEDVRVCVSS